VRTVCAIALVMLVGAGGCGGDSKESGACAAAFRWQGHMYIGRLVHLARPLPPAVGRRSIVRAPCRDSNGDADASSHTAHYDELDGIPASVALGGDRSRHELYVATDSFPELGDHPLHRYLYGADGPDAVGWRRCRTVRLAGRASTLPLVPGLRVRPTRTVRGVRLDAATRLLTPKVDGVARLVPGQQVTIRGLLCPHRTVAVGRVIRPAG
jgi:hypothetical protein